MRVHVRVDVRACVCVREGEGRGGKRRGRGREGKEVEKCTKPMANTTGICDLGCSLEGLPVGKKQQLEIADSRCDLLKLSLNF